MPKFCSMLTKLIYPYNIHNYLTELIYSYQQKTEFYTSYSLYLLIMGYCLYPVGGSEKLFRINLAFKMTKIFMFINHIYI